MTFRDPTRTEAPFRVVTLVVARFDTPSTFAVPDRNRLPVLRAFEANTLPITCRFADTPSVPIPTLDR